MSDMLLILLIASAVIIAWAAYESRRYARIVAEEEANHDFSEEHLDELGASAVATMTSRVEAIMRRHRQDRCIAVALTSGADHGPACSELHHLLPGDPVWIQADADREGVVNVFSAGYRIGEIEGPDARKALDILNGQEIHATYVCQQDCYEYYDKVAVRLIIFYGRGATEFAGGNPAGKAEELLTRGAEAFVQEKSADRGLLDGAPYRIAPAELGRAQN